jgi:hypothetical protein
MRRRPVQRALFASLASVASLACAELDAERVREHTYPPTFTYITEEQLHSAMWALADHASRLDRLMREPGEAGEDLQAQVIVQISGMERATATLGPSRWPSNHPHVSRNLARFRRDLEQARHAAELDPPNYFLAGSVSGACMHCHGGE